MLALLALACILDLLIPGNGPQVVQANGYVIGGVVALVLVGGWITAIRGNGTSDPICPANDPKKGEKIRDYLGRNSDRN